MIETCLYTHTIQNTNGCELVPDAAHCYNILISEHCKFMLVKFIVVKFKFIECQCFNHSIEADAVPSLASWTCIALH